MELATIARVLDYARFSFVRRTRRPGLGLGESRLSVALAAAGAAAGTPAGAVQLATQATSTLEDALMAVAGATLLVVTSSAILAWRRRRLGRWRSLHGGRRTGGPPRPESGLRPPPAVDGHHPPLPVAADPQAPEATLTITEGRGCGNVFLLGRRSRTVLGSSQAVDIQLLDPAVSAFHCTVVAEAGSYVLHDLGDRAGTLINEKCAHRQTLQDGDFIKLGDTTLAFKLVDSQPAASQHVGAE